MKVSVAYESFVYQRINRKPLKIKREKILIAHIFNQWYSIMAACNVNTFSAKLLQSVETRECIVLESDNELHGSRKWSVTIRLSLNQLCSRVVKFENFRESTSTLVDITPFDAARNSLHSLTQINGENLLIGWK